MCYAYWLCCDHLSSWFVGAVGVAVVVVVVGGGGVVVFVVVGAVVVASPVIVGCVVVVVVVVVVAVVVVVMVVVVVLCLAAVGVADAWTPGTVSSGEQRLLFLFPSLRYAGLFCIFF